MADGLAQLVEQRPFKAWVLGSSPRPVTKLKDPDVYSQGLFLCTRFLKGLGREVYPELGWRSQTYFRACPELALQSMADIRVYADWSEAEHR